ncbi:malto-oligosyltrehalose synthase [Microvirga lotononidis]|uniref:4-alpha-glucanotransferase n=1 Tax=Microvirga lotononidis TaxID=864069 RepID=I4YW01_9HYPH|nr:malto-oligosyltrehalose synthase [Microvirga lotononidis]EIM28143.1 4-alpha-glucanotransferase/malto-oligosyltrehalose synthase [Microvirga lotononidis]WQO27752.1 malto-oligosyltrehalose synthase [Microvirga lotononidis]
MSKLDALLERMAALVGISPDYTDAFGNSVETSPATRLALLTALGLDTSSETSARESLDRLERLKNGPVPAVVTVEADRSSTIEFRAAPGPHSWILIEENGAVHEGRLGKHESSLDLPALPTGYHRLRLGDTETTIIAAPPRCWEPDAFQGKAKLWGAVAQIYSLRSKRDLGIGDYSDVTLAAESIGRLGGAFLGLSPVHALFASDRSKISPYSPSSRLFLESIYIDPTAAAGFTESGAAKLLDEPDAKARLGRLRSAQLIDYAEVWALKRPLLDAIWERFRRSGEHDAFEAFRRAGGEALEAHATFEALSEHFREQGRFWSGDWPEEYRSVHSVAVRRFRMDHAERVAFHAWLQWLADDQLAQAAERARGAGLPIGLYRDLAVGADGGGSEIWATPERYAPELSIGAPPDPLGPQGQDWGLPPFNPLTLEEQGLAAFRDLVSANMRHAGAIRIDHAFQLQRLFLIPSGAPASQGAYVDYPFEAMLAVLRVESHRAQCLVIAEDLGTAPEGFSDAIMESGVLSYRVLPFERDGSAFKKPGEYPRSAMAVITTHDLPTFTGWWRGLDIDLRQTLGIFDPAKAADERLARAADRQHLTEALADQGLLPSSRLPDEPPLEETIRYLGRTSCVLTALQIEDASGELNQPNMPGMDAGHPNWRRRLSNTIETITSPDSLMPRLAVALAEEGRDFRARRNALASTPPRATYRLQFHKGFTFDDAVKIVPYLAKLGISHVYSSPIQTAAPGSTHGYDIVDHSTINPELGGEEGFRRLSDTLKEHGLKLLLDIVPNHMGVGGKDNGWWLSVLEWGRLSPVADAFDIDWERPGADGKLIVPSLSGLYGEVLEKGELQLKFDPEEGSFSVWHWEHRFPICPTTYPAVLDLALAAIADGTKAGELRALAERLRALKDPQEERGSLPEKAERIKRDLAQAVAASTAVKKAVDGAVAVVNGAPGQPESFNILHRLLDAQSYRLAYWRVASSDINYRRFFDINTLAGIRVEITEIFEKTHELIVRLVGEGLIHGLRIDHIDGLADPEGYTRALQRKVGPGFFVAVEKILEPGEELRPWPVAGTSGYDVLNVIDGVLVNAEAGDTFERIYRDASGLQDSYADLLKQAKVEITEKNFASELEVLVSDIKAIADADRRTRDYTAFSLRRALIEIVAAFPVYRSYLGDGEPSVEDVRLLGETIRDAQQASTLPDRSVHDFIASALLGKTKANPADIRRFRRRFQQLTGPVMAKSLEDTLFYRYGRLIALNEVGGDPGHFGLSPQAFHQTNADRARNWPYAMIATATHDTKRGEDARARLLALSEMPQEWARALDLWRDIAAPHLSEVDGALAPDANDQVILLQALLGAWPLELLNGTDAEHLAAFQERMEEYLTKALREAKRHTSWVAPNGAYEAAARRLLQAALDPQNRILDRLNPLARRLSRLGMLNGLSRTILKMTLPGVPDIYQGTEFWDFSLVDPDNRRPVDYEARIKALDMNEPAAALMESWPEGRIKQYILMRLLHDRAAAPDLYAEGDYQPLSLEGEFSTHLLGYLRQHDDTALAVIVPRLWNGLTDSEDNPSDQPTWGDTAVSLPHGRWKNVLTREDILIESDHAAMASLLGTLPFAVLKRDGGDGIPH